mmetsp:Transcript_3815/g.10605  ORF Transcript_3815/g.10605 Transcript_3815/m.10605 type:complete len:97 (-) Transcript_3815:10-300(-)
MPAVFRLLVLVKVLCWLHDKQAHSSLKDVLQRLASFREPRDSQALDMRVSRARLWQWQGTQGRVSALRCAIEARSPAIETCGFHVADGEALGVTSR